MTAEASRHDANGVPGWYRWAALIVLPAHLLVTALTMPLRSDHFVLDGVFLATAWIGPLRAMSWASIPFFLTAVAYDNSRFLTRWRGTVHVADLYRAEQRWFGLDSDQGRIILPEFFRQNPSVALDLICGFAYLAYLYEVVLVALYLFWRDRPRMKRLAWGFFAVNVAGIVTYLVYPAAPPWYVEKYGLGPAKLDTPPSAAGAARFDELLGISYFEAFYSRNANVFGAMPSLHVAYPVLVLCATASLGGVWAGTTGAFALLVAFAAVYLRHHYVWDVVVGALYGATTHLLVWLWHRHRAGQRRARRSRAGG